MTPRSLVTLASSLESMDSGEELARAAAEAAGFDEEEQYRISLAVREALINAYRHGNNQDSSKQIELEIEQTDSELVFVITDQGQGFDPNGIPDPREDEQLLAASGRGIFLMRTFMDDMTVTAADNGGTRVQLKKSIRLVDSSTGHGPEKERSS